MKCILKVGKNEYDYNDVKLVIYSCYINDKNDVFGGPIYKKYPENFDEFYFESAELFIITVDKILQHPNAKWDLNINPELLAHGYDVLSLCRFKDMIDDAFCSDESSIPYLRCVKNEDGIIITKIVDVVKAHNVFVENMKKELNGQDNDIIPLLSLEALA